jgi:PAS domain S-box-containing protein
MVNLDEKEHVDVLSARDLEFAQLVDMVPGHLWRLTPEGEPIFFNKRMVEFLDLDVGDTDKPGMSRLEAIIEAVIHPDDAGEFGEALRHCLGTGEGFALRYRLRRADGVYRWMSSRAEPTRNRDGRIVQWYGLCHDIDDQMRAQNALHDRERELSQLVNMVPSLLWRLSPDGEPIFFNQRAKDYFGLDVPDCAKPGMGRLEGCLATLVHPDDVEGVKGAFNRCFVTGERFGMKYRLRRADGVYRWMSGRAEPMRDEGGRIVQWCGLTSDIDDQMHAEAALRRSEQQLQQLIDAVPVRIWSATPTGGPLYFNKRYQDHLRSVIADFDVLEDPSIDKFVQDLIHPDDVPGVQRTLGECFQTGRGSVMRFRWREKDGAYRWAECRMEPRREQDGMIAQWYGVSLDVDDEVRAQDALRQASDKLAQATRAASLSELSASIAHELNQPLAAIVANADACRRWLSETPPNVERAKITAGRISRVANSAADVVNRIRALFKQSMEPATSATLDGVIAEARNLMADEAARRRVRMDADVERNLPPVAFDRIQIQQVLINLIRNGMDAMDSLVEDRVLEIRVRRTPDMVQTEVSDRGRGGEVTDKIFDPFFTTKKHGMGMGLTICRSIVEAHGGRLWAEKNEPHGAKFVFTLPVEVKSDHDEEIASPRRGAVHDEER